MAAAEHMRNVVKDVLTWQRKMGRERIPNKHSDVKAERNLGNIFTKLLLRRFKALGEKPCGRRLGATEVALVNSVPGVPAQGCSVHGRPETEPRELPSVEETEPQVQDLESDVGMARCSMSTVDTRLRCPADIIVCLGGCISCSHLRY